MSPTKILKVKEVLANERYPEFIRGAPPFNKVEYFRKIFPTIGIEDYTEKSQLDNKGSRKTALNFVDEILNLFMQRADDLNHFITKVRARPLGKSRMENSRSIISILKSLAVSSSPESYISLSLKGTIVLSLPMDIVVNDKPFFKKGMSLLKVYNKLSEMLSENKFLKLPVLEDMHAFKIFSSTNLPSNECTIHFSSSTEEGIWDIATMSMRGITTCQTWQNASNFVRVMGSMIDPMTGIIYMTSGGSGVYGSNMMRRCIVRYALSKRLEPTLIIEKMYPAHDQASLEAFIKSLSSKFNGPVVFIDGKKMGDSSKRMGYDYFIPMTAETRTMRNNYLPYIDSTVQWGIHNTKFTNDSDNIKGPYVNYFAKLFEKQFKSNKLTSAKKLSKTVKSNNFLSLLRSKAEKKLITYNKKRIPAKEYAARIAQELAESVFNNYVAFSYMNSHAYHFSVGIQDFFMTKGASSGLSAFLTNLTIETILLNNKTYA